MRWSSLSKCLAVAGLSTMLTIPPLAAQESDEQFWPCIQRKVPHLSLPQIWNGPELPSSAENWQDNPEVSALVTEVAARRVPLEEAQQRIRDFAAGLSGEAQKEHLLMLVQGLFDHMDRERADVMDGIERYTRGQVAMADALRQETAAVDTLRRNPDSDPDEVARRVQELEFQTRVFQERAESLTYVCEVPAVIESRLYQLANTVLAVLQPSGGG